MFLLFCQFLINHVTITMYVNEEYFVPKIKILNYVTYGISRLWINCVRPVINSNYFHMNCFFSHQNVPHCDW